MSFCPGQIEQLEEIAKELNIELDDGGYRDYLGIPVYKVWTNSKEESKKLYEKLIKRGFSSNRTFLDTLMITIDAS